MTYAEQLRAHLRLAVLQTLEVSPGYGVHEYLILDRIVALGLGTTRDALGAELAWLAETGLITTQPIEDALVAHLTRRGADVARGLAIVPGVVRPRP